ncbi:MAG: ATP-binding cassette domain-containing protein, partial [Solirubrobacterales bacterium]|nr:ATP-binding cassette domain-containing protein [Solirubrobacterales bacterium]
MLRGESERAIQVEGLTQKFRKGPLAVDGIDLHVDPGEIYGFLGPNGAGKTTFLRLLAGLLERDRGELFFDGASYDRL